VVYQSAFDGKAEIDQFSTDVANGPSPTWRDVRDLIVIKGKADVMRTSDFGSD
jgi:hypothetical protein